MTTPATPATPATPDELTAAFDADFAAERFRAAAARGADLALDAVPEALIATALRCRLLAGAPIDRVIIAARAALRHVTAPTARALLHAELAYALARKRTPILAATEADAATAAWPASSLGPAAHGHVALAFDRRDDALAQFTAATALDAPYRGWMGLARTRYVLGDFAGAAAALDQLGDLPRTRVAALRLRANLARVAADWPTLLGLEDAILDATPGGDYRRRDQLDRASALVASGDRDAGIEQYRAVWREIADDEEGLFARAVLDHVERGGEGRRVTLPAFPTVTQKRNYCGPASLELVLRAHGIAVDQDAIAPAVKRDSGSPLVAMTRYLEGRGLATRRFESTPARLAACLDLGLPVIVQEEYSITSHVAVVIGVDLGLGLLAVQDPMTHVPSERLIATQTSLSAMYRGAAIVAVPADDATRIAALDAADVLDQRHLRLVDECADPAVRDQVLQVVERCDAALALVEDYPLAWYQRTAALWRQATRSRTKVDRARFVTALFRARVRYPAHEWPHLLHADLLMDDGRWDEALIELTAALVCDPHDSHTAQNIAEAHGQADRPAEATAAYWHTLQIDPSHIRATENFARHQLDDGLLDDAEHLAACALELAPGNPFNHVTVSQVAAARGDRATALAHARRAVEVAPDYHHGSLRLAALLAAGTDDDGPAEALALYRGMTTRWPGWFEPRYRAARQLERQGAIDEAVELLVAGIECATDEPEVLLTNLTSILLEDGDDARAAELARRFAATSRNADMQSRLWSTLDDAGEVDAALAATAAFLALHPNSPFAQASHGSRLAGGSPADDARAEELLRAAIDGSPTYGWARGELASLIFVDRPDEALAILAAQPDAPSWITTRRVHLLCSLDRWDEAAALLATLRQITSWTEQEAYNRVALAERDPDLARACTTGDDLPARRARLAFAIAGGDLAVITAAFAGVPDDDLAGNYMANAGASLHEELRPELARRLRTRRAATTDLSGQRYLDALAAGNDAATGDRAALDRFLATRNVRHLDAVATPLHARRQRAISLDVRVRMAELAHHPVGASAAISVAALRGDLPAAVAAATDASARFPRHDMLRSALVSQLVFAGDLAAATTAAAPLARLADPWASQHASLALVALLGGDRTTAALHARRGRQRGFASGYDRTVYGGLRGVEAVLANDAAALERAHADADYTDAPGWAALRAALTA